MSRRLPTLLAEYDDVIEAPSPDRCDAVGMVAGRPQLGRLGEKWVCERLVESREPSVPAAWAGLRGWGRRGPLTLLKDLSDHRVRSSAIVTVGHAQNLSVLGIRVTVIIKIESQCSDASCRSSGWKSRRWNRPVATVVISGDGEGDRPVESPEVKASAREASNSAGRSNGESVSPEIV
jgi:hypothetical protein